MWGTRGWKYGLKAMETARLATGNDGSRDTGTTSLCSSQTGVNFKSALGGLILIPGPGKWTKLISGDEDRERR